MNSVGAIGNGREVALCPRKVPARKFQARGATPIFMEARLERPKTVDRS
jgi:hypothetical protein